MNHEGDEENENTNRNVDSEDTKYESPNKDNQITDKKNSESAPRGFTGFFKKFSSKKSVDIVGAKNETNDNANSTPSQPEMTNESNDNHITKSDKETPEDEGKKRISFFRKIGFTKKSSDTSSAIENKKEDDELSNDRYNCLHVLKKYQYL